MEWAFLAAEYCKNLEREGQDIGVEVDKERNREMVEVCGSMRKGYDSIVDFIRERTETFNRARIARQREVAARRHRIESEKEKEREQKANEKFANEMRRKYSLWRGT